MIVLDNNSECKAHVLKHEIGFDAHDQDNHQD